MLLWLVLVSVLLLRGGIDLFQCHQDRRHTRVFLRGLLQIRLMRLLLLLLRLCVLLLRSVLLVLPLQQRV